MSSAASSADSSLTGALRRCLAFDFGAGSGRAMIAHLQDGDLQLEELHRFDTGVIEADGQTCWDMAALHRGLEDGLGKAQSLGPLDAIGIDSWGVDFGLLDEHGELIAPPLHYRNGHGRRGLARGLLSLDDMHRRTGAQRLDINTVFQLLELAERRPAQLAAADAMLLMADLLSAHLTGERYSEYTLASTSGLFDIGRGDWHWALIDELGLPRRLFKPILMPGQPFGVLRRALRGADGHPTPVFAVGAHDTASAVAGLNLSRDDAFLILGSWSLLGVETAAAGANERTLRNGFGIEGGAEGTQRLITNINGLYLIQMLREGWRTRHGEAPGFAEITAAAGEADLPVRIRIDPSDARFFAPADLIDAIDDFCRARRWPLPATLGAYALAVYRGLADQIASGVATLEDEFGRPIAAIHVSGGGSQDTMLCECIAEASGKPLRFGPVEASARGNVFMQLRGLGVVGSLAEARTQLGSSQAR